MSDLTQLIAEILRICQMPPHITPRCALSHITLLCEAARSQEDLNNLNSVYKVREIADRLGVTERSARRFNCQRRDAGLISVEYNGAGRGNSRCEHIMIPADTG